jgi:hypothetical protein
MRIIITETQKRIILRESNGEEIKNTIKTNTEKIEKIIKESKEQIGINLEFLLTWGAGIGGFMGPVEDFIQGRFPDLSETEFLLLMTGVIATYFVKSKKTLTKIYNKIKEKNLDNKFESTLKKSDSLYQSFLDLVESLNLTIHNLSNMLSYTFIIPILPNILSMVENESSLDISTLTKRIIGFIGVTIAGVSIKEFISKIISKLR